MRLQLHSLTRWLAILATALVALPAVAQQPSATKDNVCLTCHADAMKGMATSKHAVTGDARTPFGSGQGCQSCHVNAEEHLKNPTKAKPQSFSKTSPGNERSEPCLTCHKGGTKIHWAGSAHDRNDIGCNDCHKAHAPKDQVLVAATQAGVCFDCHKNVRAATLGASTHPIKTGWMPCSSCHQPHGSVGPANLVKNTVNETCYTCHAEKRGPFLWEHPPAREDCATCHAPHGSNNAPLLVARGPFLCQQCHMNPFHPSTVYSGNNLPPFAIPNRDPSKPPIQGAPAGDKMLGQNCANCHTKVHGSNHPSGARFTR